MSGLLGEGVDRKEEVYRAAVRLAENVGASAIMLLTEMPVESTPTSIPVLTCPEISGLSPEHHLPKAPSKEGCAESLTSITRAEVLAMGRSAASTVSTVADVAGVVGMVDGGLIVGVVSSHSSDSIVVYDLSESIVLKALDECADRVDRSVMQSVINFAITLGYEGREGRKVGTLLVIGDLDEVLRRSHQLILNPFEGHPESERLITNPKNWETLKEFAQLDGAFILDERGVVVAAGRYLDVDARSVSLVKGLGGRHVSAAAITRDTNAIAVVLSESAGKVRTFKDGHIIMEIPPKRIERQGRARR
ncbi:MAG: DNA integrity scanning protein DisA nucleotide-binding domain protein [Methermicoccaceae archaeon]